MSETLSFGVRLGRLLDRRGHVRRLPRPSHGGARGQPQRGARRRDSGSGVAAAARAALNLHTADLFLFAGRTLPDDLTPSLLTGPWNVGSLLYWHHVYDMPAPAFAELRRFVTALPDRRTPRTSPWPADDRGPGPGAVLWRWVGNRNTRLDLAVMKHVGDGSDVSTATYAMVLHGKRPLTAEYVNAFARVLGIPSAISPHYSASLRWTSQNGRCRTSGPRASPSWRGRPADSPTGSYARPCTVRTS